MITKEKAKLYKRRYRARIKSGIIPTPPHVERGYDQTEYHREYYRKYRDEAISHYSDGKNECACCGEKTKEFLSLDHIHGGGRRHRQEIKTNIYWWCKKNGWPNDYQVLCHNCNQAIGCYGICPHKKHLQNQ